MRRSEINAILREADAFIRQQQFHLPPFAYWAPEDWSHRGADVAEIVANNLGWDITDFGQGDYRKIGLFLFTIRNGSPQNLEHCTGKVYAEKLLIVDVQQVTPFHFHWQKMEDIINRGGGSLLIQLYNSTPDERADETREIIVSVDSVERRVAPGGDCYAQPRRKHYPADAPLSQILGGRKPRPRR